MSKKEIHYWDRAACKLEVEKVYGDAVLQWAYRTPTGRFLTEKFMIHPWVSRLYGEVQSSPWSARKISSFIKSFNIKMEEFESKDFSSFNDFFIRKFKPGVRPFTTIPTEMPAFAEARYLAFENIREDQTFPVKGRGLSAEGLLGNLERAAPFIGGPLLLARLCPVDYHRFHYPAAGRTLEETLLSGVLHSVNPVALQQNDQIFIQNERRVSILETADFGKLAYVEVGALCVGKIIQTHPTQQPFSRGQEKGYFLFGGSTVIVLGEPGAWRPDADLLQKTQEQIETFVQIGQRVAYRI